MTVVTPVDLYTAGTISLTNGSDIVFGDGTFWEAVAMRGDALWIAERSLLIKEVLADDQIRIVAPWGGDTIADQPYALSYTSWLRYSVAELQGGVRDVIAFWRMGGVRGTREVTLPIDAITVGDLNKVVVYNSATAVAASIPQAAADGKLIDGWACWLKVRGAGPVTLTPATSTINGAASLVLAQGDAAMLWSHGGGYEAAVFHSGEDGEDGGNGATIYVQDEAPSVAGPLASIWIDKNSPDLDVYQLGGDPPAWSDTGANLKGTPGTPGDNGTNGTNGINGASALTVVRTAATANVNIASALENGDAVSGVTLATNDLVLLTAQTAPAENGVYVVAASGAASRHASFASYDAHPGCYFSACEGTGVADTLWRCTSDRGGTLGTTALAISQFTAGGAGRELLTANRTYYVLADGSDSNNGLSNSAGGAFLTIQKAANVVGALDASIYNVTISIGAGTFSEDVKLPAVLGSGVYTLTGAGVASTTIKSIEFLPRSTWKYNNVKVSGGVSLIILGAFSNVRANGPTEYGAATDDHIRLVDAMASWIAESNYTISGGAARHWRIDDGGMIFAYGRTVTLTNSPNFSDAFVRCVYGGKVIAGAMTFNNKASATGMRYLISTNAIVGVDGGGETYLPGSSNGYVDTTSGGIYR